MLALRQLAITAVFFFVIAAVVQAAPTTTPVPLQNAGIVVVVPDNDNRGYSPVGGFRKGDVERAICGALSEYFSARGAQVLDQIPPTARVWNKGLGISEFRLPPQIREIWLVRATSTGTKQDSPNGLGLILGLSGLARVRTQRCDIAIEAKVLTRQGEHRFGPFVGTGKSQEVQVNDYMLGGNHGDSGFGRILSLQNLSARSAEMLFSNLSNVETTAFEKAWAQFAQAVWPDPPVQTTTTPSRQPVGTTKPGRRELPVIRPPN